MSRIKTTSLGFGRKPDFSDIVGALSMARQIIKEGTRSNGWIMHPLANERGVNAQSTPRWLMFRKTLAKMLVNRNTEFTATA